MGALPRPQVDAGPHRDLVEALHDLHHRAGWPSLRRLASEVGCSHTTVSHAFSSSRLPSWGLIEVLVEALGGEPSDFHALWLAASTNGASPATTTAPGAPAAASRLAGRRAELAAVRHHLEAGSGLLLVAGEAGIGKTALVNAGIAEPGPFVAVGHCLPLSTEVPMMPVVDLLRAVHDTDHGQWFKEALAGSPAFVRGELSRLLPELADVPPSTGEFSRQHLLAALATCVQQLSGSRPLALVVEDAHWADPATLDLLEYLVLHDTRVPFVATWRTDDPAVTRDHLAWRDRLCRLASVTVRDLGPLTLEGTTEQLRLAGDPDPDRARRIHARSRGHPLFTTQLAHQADEGAPLTPLLTDLLDARLGTLTGPPWMVARALGLADRPLETAILAAATDLEVDTLTPALRSLASRHLVSRRDGRTIALDHPLLAEAVRRRLVPGEAEEQHRRLALALGARDEPDAAEVSQHWQRAGDCERELAWRVRAAREARARTAPREESEHWLRVLDLWPPAVSAQHGLTRVEAQLATISALEFSGSEDRALAVATQSLRDAVEPTDRAALLHCAAAFTWGQLGPVPALELADEALRIRRALGDPEQIANLLVLRANLLAASQSEDQTHLRVLEEAHELTRDCDDPGLVWKVASTSVWHHAAAGDLAGALAWVAEARTAHQDPLPREEVYLAMMHTDALLMHARPADEVARAGHQALFLKRELGLDFTLSHLVEANIAQAFLREGRVAEAEGLLPARAGGSTSYTDWPLRMVAAMVGVARGEFETAIRALGLPSQADALNDLAYRLPGAEALLWRGEPGSAIALLLPLLEGAERQARFTGPVFRMAAWAVADATVGRVPVAEDALRHLLHLRATAPVDPLGPGRVPGDRLALTTTWTAELSRLDGNETTSTWLQAASEWGTLRRPHDAAYCRWRAAQAALRDGQATLASRLLKRAARDAREHVPLSRAIAHTSTRAAASTR